LFPALALAQEGLVDPTVERPGHRLTVEASGAYDSNVLRNDLVMGLYRGGNMDPAVLDRNRDVVGDANRAGYDLQGRITFAWGDSLFGHSAWRPRIGLSYRSVLGIRFPADVYALTFYGNTDHVDRTAHIGPSAFQQVNYQSFRIGVEDLNTGTFLELAFIHGWSLNTGTIRKADLYTAPDGRFIDLTLDGTYRRSDGRGPGRGLGAAINAEWHKQLDLPCCDAQFSLAVSDLGFIAWNPRARSVSKDSTIHYDGITVTDILDLDGLMLNNATLQDSLGLTYAEGSFITALPATIKGGMAFGKLKHACLDGTKRAYAVELDQTWLPGYVPHGSLRRNLVLSRHWLATVGAGYGGFGGARVLAGVEGLVLDHLKIGVGTPNLVGLCSADAQGKALGFSLEVVW
jgi:hypothetical protein